MELGRQSALLEYFNHLSAQMLRHMSNYHQDVQEASEYANSNPRYSIIVVLNATEGLKLAVINYLCDFDKLLENFMDSLGEGERESVRKAWFLLDEMRKNQSKINALHDAYLTRLKGLTDPGNERGVLGVDLDSLSTSDTIIIAESFSMFNAALCTLFPEKYARFGIGLFERNQDTAHPDDKAVRKNLKSKAIKINALGMTIKTDIKSRFKLFYEM